MSEYWSRAYECAHGGPGARDPSSVRLLCRPLAILTRIQTPAPRLTCWEKLGLAVLAAKLSRLSAGARTALHESLLLFKPETVLGRHRALVRRKWTIGHRSAPGRPRISAEL